MDIDVKPIQQTVERFIVDVALYTAVRVVFPFIVKTLEVMFFAMLTEAGKNYARDHIFHKRKR